MIRISEREEARQHGVAWQKDYEKLYLVFKTIYNIKERSEKNVFTS